MRLKKTPEFDQRYRELELTQRAKVDARLDNISIGHFGDSRSLHEGLFELKWKNGMRVYYLRSMGIVVLLGGFKDSQRRDIARARLLVMRHKDEL